VVSSEALLFPVAEPIELKSPPLFPMETIFLYVKESYNELLHKVTWPSFQDLLSSTTVVLIASAIIALIILIMDIFSIFFSLKYIRYALTKRSFINARSVLLFDPQYLIKSERSAL